MQPESGIAARIDHLESDTRELRNDIRDLTKAVASLGQSVAVLAERVVGLTRSPVQAGDVVSPSRPMQVTPLVAVGAGAGGAVAVLVEVVRRAFGIT
jgi:hypothetical protein